MRTPTAGDPPRFAGARQLTTLQRNLPALATLAATSVGSLSFLTTDCSAASGALPERYSPWMSIGPTS